MSENNGNQYFCEKCDAKVPKATKQMKVVEAELPNYLIVILNRFKYSNGQLIKVMDDVQVESMINVAGVDYQFKSSVIHAGKFASAGHYYSVRQTNEHLTIYNDSNISRIKLEGTDECYLNRL